MKKGWLVVALIACILGIVCAGISLNSFFEIQKNGVGRGSFCAISEYINCDTVEASSYASIKGVPLAGVGLIYYVFVLIMVAFARFVRGFRKPEVAFVWWTSGLSVLFAGYLAYVSTEILHVICLTCVGMYVANIVLFISLYLAMGMPFSEGKKFLWGYWATIISRQKKGIDFMPNFFLNVLVAVIIFGIGLVFLVSASSKTERITDQEMVDYVDMFNRQSKYDINFDKDSRPVWGKRGAPVTIVEFSEFMCPFCKIAAFKFRPFLTEFRDKVEYYFINYPLDSTCNHYMEHQMHPGACLGAKAVICASKDGKFWEYHDELFKSQGKPIDDKLIMSIAGKLKLNKNDFEQCLSSVETENILRDDIEVARKIYITGTPSIFINNKPMRFWKSPEITRTIVEQEINASKNPAEKK